MDKQVAQSLKDLSEDIVNTILDRFVEEATTSINNLTKKRPIDRGGDLKEELTSYVHNSISAELGRITALLEVSETAAEVKQVLNENIRNIYLSDMEFSFSAHKALKEAGYKTLGELLDLNPVDVMDIQGFGDVSRIYLTNYLRQRGIDWPGEVTLDMIRARRFERLDRLTLREILKQSSYSRADRWEVKVLTDREFREYILGRVVKADDKALYPFALNTFTKIFSRATVRELEFLGISTFGDLLPLTMEQLAEKTAHLKTADAIISNIITGLATIGRSIK